MTTDPGLDLAVELRMSLVNLHGKGVWQQSGQEREWRASPLQLGGSQGEQQLLGALSRPLQRFLRQVAPPPSTQVRDFDLSGR